MFYLINPHITIYHKICIKNLNKKFHLAFDYILNGDASRRSIQSREKDWKWKFRTDPPRNQHPKQRISCNQARNNPYSPSTAHVRVSTLPYSPRRYRNPHNILVRCRKRLQRPSDGLTRALFVRPSPNLQQAIHTQNSFDVGRPDDFSDRIYTC